MKELERSAAQMEKAVHRKIIAWTQTQKSGEPYEIPFAIWKRHVGESASMWKNVLCAGETKIRLFGLDAKHYI